MTQASRIFWMGAHRVLKATELSQLRVMGFEVFNPAYLSDVYDQSMSRNIDIDQVSTLPEDIFKRLLAYNFFYNNISDEIADILNSYFDVVIVTISADWLHEFLKVFERKIIYRIYGQQYSLSEHAVATGIWHRIVGRGNFVIVPFAAESIETEHQWFRDLCVEIVPYQLADDIFAYSGIWKQRQHRPEIATSIPNIQNPYYAAAYADFNLKYPHRVFRIYGPQRETPDDARIVGALERNAFIERLAKSSGYLYPYTDQVCYLPPIESMEIGAPVIYAEGSLLSRFHHGPSPGLIRDAEDAEVKMRLLISGDQGFIDEIIGAQEHIRQRYDRNFVKPVFERVFRKLLSKDYVQNQQVTYDPPIIGKGLGGGGKARASIWVFLHVPGLFSHVKGRVYAFEGIPRVVDTLIETIIRFTPHDVVLTCTMSSMPTLFDFFAEHIDGGRITLRGVDCDADRERGDCLTERLSLVQAMNNGEACAMTVVPHYYLFPEALLLRSRIFMYLPDYFPHVMPGVVFDTSAAKDAENKKVGVAIAHKAQFILTNSMFTKSYLPDAGFLSPRDSGKVIVAPLPLLGENRTDEISTSELHSLSSRLAGQTFIFYPTANRPNKQIAFLLRLFASLLIEHPRLKLVLTCDLASVPGVTEVARRYDLMDKLVFCSRVSEGALRWLYRRSAALCLTTTLEGNFPPQVLEALSYQTPVVATRLIQITERIGELQTHLLLCEPTDIDDFRQKLLVALENREAVVSRQDRVLTFLRDETSIESFYNALSPIFESLQDRPSIEGH